MDYGFKYLVGVQRHSELLHIRLEVDIGDKTHKTLCVSKCSSTGLKSSGCFG